MANEFLLFLAGHRPLLPTIKHWVWVSIWSGFIWESSPICSFPWGPKGSTSFLLDFLVLFIFCKSLVLLLISWLFLLIVFSILSLMFLVLRRSWVPKSHLFLLFLPWILRVSCNQNLLLSYNIGLNSSKTDLLLMS